MTPKLGPTARLLSRLIPVIFLTVAGWVLWRELHSLSPQQILAQIDAWGADRIAAVVGLCAFSYLLLAANETLALRWARAHVPARDSFAVSFIAYAFANNLGLSLIVTGVIRARAYARHGVDLATIAGVTLYCTMAFWLGFSLFAGLSLVLAKKNLFTVLGLAPDLGRAVGVAMLLLPVFYVLACAMWRKPIVVRGRAWTAPPPLWAVGQVMVGVGDNIAMSTLIWLLLDGHGPGFAEFASAYAASLAAGLVSGLPGGVGVFESTMLTLLPTLDRAVLAAAFIGYRLFYYLAPLMLAAGLLGFRERDGVRRALTAARQRLRPSI